MPANALIILPMFDDTVKNNEPILGPRLSNGVNTAKTSLILVNILRPSNNPLNVSFILPIVLSLINNLYVKSLNLVDISTNFCPVNGGNTSFHASPTAPKA